MLQSPHFLSVLLDVSGWSDDRLAALLHDPSTRAVSWGDLFHERAQLRERLGAASADELDARIAAGRGIPREGG